MGDERKGPGALNQESVGEPSVTPRPTWNTSGQGKDASVPIEVDGRWNWAAFLLPTVFAGINRLWLWLVITAAPVVLFSLDIVPGGLGGRFGLSSGQLVLSIILAKRGNALAWRSRRWESIEHFQRTQRRWAWGSLAALIAVLALVVATEAGEGASSAPRGSSEPGHYDAHGVSFDYPAGWQYDAGAEFLVGLDELKDQAEWVDAFYEEGAEGVVAVAASDVGVRITERRLKRAADLIVERVVPEGGSLEGEPQVTTVGGLPSIRLSLRIPNLDGGMVGNDLVLAYRDSTQFLVKCQYPLDHAAAVHEACEQIANTFQVSTI
jgi:hypothetical protein